MGFGDLICDMDSGRPFGMSTESWDTLLLDDRCEERCDESLECRELLLLDEEWCDLDECLRCGTSRMFSSRPVVGSTVDGSLGLCETWYPSMM
jgi:hypothetical protein